METSLQQRDDLLWCAFRVFDTDGDGEITLDELVKVLHSDDVTTMAAGTSPEEKKDKVRKLIEEFDKDKDGVIDFEEFKATMKDEGAPNLG